MKTVSYETITRPDYNKIQAQSHCMDCVISEADFNTNHPNPYRIDYAVSDINRYGKNRRDGK